MKKLRDRWLSDESGFTLPELLVTMLMMLTVMFALYSIFDMGIRVFSFGNDKVEAVENARLGLERMEREIRSAYPVNGDADPRYLFFAANGVRTSPPSSLPGNRQITFGNETATSEASAERIDCNPAAVPSTDPAYTPCEYITYRLSNQSGSANATRTLLRNNGADGSDPSTGGEPVIEFVDGIDGLIFEYFTEDGVEIDPLSPGSYTEADIARVRITLMIRVPGIQDGTQRLTTDVDLRNR